MITITFKSVDELKDYLEKNHYTETKFFIEPDYVKSIFGITSSGLLLYSYTHMVEDLYLDYSEVDEIEDPYEAAIEWIDFNVTNIGSGSPIVVYEPPMEGYDCLFDVDGLDNFLKTMLKQLLVLISMITY